MEGGPTVTFILSRKESKKKATGKSGFTALLDGYSFDCDKSGKASPIRHYWRCQDQTCDSRIITNDDGLVLRDAKPEHNHDPPKEEVSSDFKCFLLIFLG